MTGLKLYVWFEGEEGNCDEISLPQELSLDEARGLALLKLHEAPTSTRAHVQLRGNAMIDIAKIPA